MAVSVPNGIPYGGWKAVHWAIIIVTLKCNPWDSDRFEYFAASLLIPFGKLAHMSTKSPLTKRSRGGTDTSLSGVG